MVDRIYTPNEVAEILKIPQEAVQHLVETMELKAFLADRRYVRVTEEALKEFINRPYPSEFTGKPDAGLGKVGGGVMLMRRNRNTLLESEGRSWALDQIKKACGSGSLRVHTRRHFTVDGKQGIMGVSTTPSGTRAEYWFGFSDKLLVTDLPTFIVPVLADRKIAFVIPYNQHKPLFDGLSRDRLGEKKFNIEERSGSFYLKGVGVPSPLSLAAYVNSFNRFR